MITCQEHGCDELASWKATIRDAEMDEVIRHLYLCGAHAGDWQNWSAGMSNRRANDKQTPATAASSAPVQEALLP